MRRLRRGACAALTAWLALAGSAARAAPAPGPLPTASQAAGAATASVVPAPPPVDCDAATDRLTAVRCTGVLRVGVRGDYPLFAELHDGERRGFEIDLARALAAWLGVAAEFVGVGPADRIAALAEGRADLVVATTGHTRQRDEQALFVRPHYYQSQTVVLGPRGLALARLPDLAGRTVCVTVGNSTNAALWQAGARLMLWPDARTLLAQLDGGACALAAQDDSLVAAAMRDPGFAARLEPKFGFAPLPWGVMVGRDDGAALAQALGLALQALHADGTLRALARAQGVDTPFLQAQQALWAAPPCAAPQALDDSRCVLPPVDLALTPSRLAPLAERIEQALQRTLGWEVSLAMLHTEVALRRFGQGVGFSLALVAGAIAATLAGAVAFGAGLAARPRWLRWPLRTLVVAAQSTPLMLLMAFAGVVLASLGTLTPMAALLAAVLVLGLFNGSNAGQAVAEAHAALRAAVIDPALRATANDPAPRAAGEGTALRQALWQARGQVMAFVVNAVRGSPAASVIGVPELLAAQTDIASFASDRATTFALLLLFYLALVTAVVAAGNRLLARWERARAAGSAGSAPRG
jgi:ABC-type amino acid transport substrate-binding protein/ABC-type amino acid transport system permease subunit